MLTKERTSKTRKFKYAAVALALLAVLVFCFASCGKATPVGIEYVDQSAAKVEYNPGETFDCTGAKVKVTYDNGASEEVAVTPEMVGSAPLTLGVESVSVTYSENGATVVGHIPVTVVDPNAKLKADTIAALSANKTVVDNKTDAGVALLVGEYAAKIKAAATTDAITALVANFEADLDKHIDAKNEVLAKVDAKDLTGLYGQFKKDIDTAKEDAKANIKAASTIDEAKDYLAAFEAAVANKLAEQKYYEGGDGANGQINDKIALLEELERYEAVITDYEQIVKDADTLTPGEKETNLAYYAGVREDISYQEKYITLAIDLGSVDLEDTIGSQLITEVDEAVDIILEKDKITIYPRAYTEGVLQNDEDTDTMKLIKSLEDKFAAAAARFGLNGVEKLKARYGQPAGAATDDVNYINLLIEKIQTRYNELNAIREAAETANIIGMIDAAAALDSTGVEGDAQDMAIRDAWTTIKTWNTANSVFSMVGEGEKVIIANYDLQFAGVIYTATGFDEAEQKWTTIDETWDAYDVTETYVESYFIPNIDTLIEASQARYAAQALLAINNDKLDLDNLFYAVDADVDSGAEITDARTRYDAFKAAYVDGKGEAGQAIYNKYFVAADEDRLKAAKTKYDDLIAKATAANDAIAVYDDLIYSNVANIVVGHYAAEGGALKDAYDKYCTFAFANGEYTDVITKEASLLAYMDQYTMEVAYKDAKDVEAAKTIKAAWITRDDAAKVDADAHPTFRTALETFAADMTTYIQTNYTYDTLPAGLVVEGVTVDADNAKFYYNAILAENVRIVEEAAAEVVATINASVSRGPVGDETNFGLVNPLIP